MKATQDAKPLPGAVTAQFDGIVHYLAGSRGFASRRGVVHHTCDGGRTWTPFARLPLSPAGRFKSAGRLPRRLWRATVYHVVPLRDGALVVFGHRAIFRIGADGRCTGTAPLRGSRPLCVCATGGEVYYGEYRGNPERTPVHVWASRDEGATWTPVHAFRRIRHVHGVFADSHDGAIWITTGDSDAEAAIWRTRDRFGTVERVAGGSQQTRVVQLLFTRRYVYFGSDAPGDVNHLYRLHRADGSIERLQEVEGPVYYGCQAGGRLFFSTACEPATLPAARDVAVWSSADGERWQRFAVFRKDRWPTPLFQHGQVLFPGGPGAPEADGVWLTPFATEGDQRSVELRFASPGPHAVRPDDGV